MEIHPVVPLASTILGTIAGPLLGVVAKAAAGLVVAIYWRRFAPCILLAAGYNATNDLSRIDVLSSYPDRSVDRARSPTRHGASKELTNG